MVEVKVRSPTGPAWLLFILPFVVAGELLFESQRKGTARLFGVPFTDGELNVWAAAFALVALVGLAWLLRLYLSPGRLRVGSERVERSRRGLLGSRTVAAPPGEWTIHLDYFSLDHRNRGVFKRLQLEGPGWSEVLLYSDCRDGQTLARTIESLAAELKALRVEVERDS